MTMLTLMRQHLPPHIQAGNIAGTPITVLRWDLNHATISGNKAEKLAWHLHILNQLKYKHEQLSILPHVVSMGGPWSNHLHALGAASQLHHFQCTALVRGEAPNKPSPTLNDLTHWQTNLNFTTRTEYRIIRDLSIRAFNDLNPAQYPFDAPLTDTLNTLVDDLPGLSQLTDNMTKPYAKHLHTCLANSIHSSKTFCSKLHRQIQTFQHFTEAHHNIEKYWWIPEGGNSALGIWSIALWAKNTSEHLEKKNGPGGTWIVPIGSSATFKGILAGIAYANLTASPTVIGVPVFKNAGYLSAEIEQFAQFWLAKQSLQQFPQHIHWQLWQNPSIGKFGKLPKNIQLQQPILEHALQTPLDPVYTLKVAHVLAQWLTQPELHTVRRPDEPIYFLHTGGLQGSRDLIN